MKYGVKRMDALHLASALAAECERFLTTDKGILRHVSSLEGMKVRGCCRGGLASPKGFPFIALCNRIRFKVWLTSNVCVCRFCSRHTPGFI